MNKHTSKSKLGMPFSKRVTIQYPLTRISKSRNGNELLFSDALFRLDALAFSVIATATWLAGWLGGWLGGWLSVTAGIVSKRLNVSENFFDHLIAPS